MIGHRIDSAKQAREFILAGKAVVTFKSLKSGNHLTYRIARNKRPRSERDIDTFFVKVRAAGPDGELFQYIGMIVRNEFRTTAKVRLPLNSPQVLAFRFAYERIAREVMPPDCEVWHEGRCGRCARALTDPASIARGLGAECAGKMEAVAA